MFAAGSTGQLCDIEIKFLVSSIDVQIPCYPYANMTSDKFSLKWKNFQENIANTFHGLRQDLDFSDVTLVCEEVTQFKAHRVILSACSPFFSSVLKRNKNSQPLIYMRDVKSNVLMAILDFIYHGEANIQQADLESFLGLAEELQLKGLAGTGEERQEEKNIAKLHKDTLPKHEISHHKELTATNYESVDKISQASHDNQLVVPKVVYASKNLEFEAKIASMMESLDDEEYKWRCTVCGQSGKTKQATSRHVESHIEGFSHPCNLCGKTSRTSKGLSNHISLYHRN